MLEFIFMWAVGLLAWANIFIWGTVIAVMVLNLVIRLIMTVIPTVKNK